MFPFGGLGALFLGANLVS